MSRMRIVILHVGLHKTATSSIQKSLFFDINNKILDEKGFIYLKSWPANHSIAVYSMFCDNPENYHMNIRKGYSKKEIKNINENYKKKLMEEIKNKKSSNLIISGEDISILNKNNLKSLKEYISSVCDGEVNIRVVVYVRNPISWVVSKIQEEVKDGEMTLQRALIEYKKHSKYHFRLRIDNLIQVFGKDTLDVYSFENAIAHEFGPVGHFLSVLGFNDKEISKFNIIKSNESISQITANLISYINEKIPLFKNGKINKQRFSGDIYPLLKVRGSKFDISYKFKKELLEIAMEDIKWLNDNLGIDYSNIQILPSNNFRKRLSQETIEDIRMVFNQCSDSIKLLIVEYFLNQLKETKDLNNKLQLEGLCCYLQKNI